LIQRDVALPRAQARPSPSRVELDRALEAAESARRIAERKSVIAEPLVKRGIFGAKLDGPLEGLSGGFVVAEGGARVGQAQ
jgi:hypothetical protein